MSRGNVMRSNRTINYFRSLLRSAQDLTGKEKEVLLSRLVKKTHDRIGKDFNLSEARIRQIEETGLVKIKSKSRQLALFEKLLFKKLPKE